MNFQDEKDYLMRIIKEVISILIRSEERRVGKEC